MRSLSSVVKSAHVIMDNKKFVLSSKITLPEIIVDERHSEAKKNPEEIVFSAHEEARAIIERAMEEAQDHINHAKDESERIISDGMDQAKELMDKSRMEGFQEGQQKGFEEGRQIAQSLIDEALDTKAAATRQYQEMLLAAEPEIVQMILDITSKVLNKALEDDSYILQLVQLAINQCTYTTDVVLKVSEEDFNYVQMEKDKILSLCPSVENIEIKIDRGMTRGGCVIESPVGTIDVSIQTQLDYIVSRFEAILQSE